MKNLQIQINVSAYIYLKDPSTSDLGRKIISNSIEMINELGFEAFTFKKLAQKISSTESSIYRYFESKHMLLMYLAYWYWSWIEYKIVFAITNIDSPVQKLENAISVLTKPLLEDKSVEYINEKLLDEIIVNEGVKTYHVKEVDKENENGCFEVYKRIVQRLSDFILEINPHFECPHMLVSTIVEGAHQQRFFAEHIPLLTDVKNNGEENISKFYIQLALKAIKN